MSDMNKIRRLFYFLGMFLFIYLPLYADNTTVKSIDFELWFNSSGSISKWNVTFTPNITSPLIIPYTDSLSDCLFGITLVDSNNTTIFTFTNSSGTNLAAGSFFLAKDKNDPYLFWQLQNKIATTSVPQIILLGSLYSTTDKLFSVLFASGRRNVTGILTPGNSYGGTLSLSINAALQTSQGVFSIISSRFFP